MRQSTATSQRVIGLWGATGIGVAAIVGGGILVLAGAAFATAGPSATLAVAINGVIAFLTAMSFAEMSTAFPQSGGAYVFANKVLSVRAAFGVGWVLWFAYIVACVLYALGFAAFAVLVLQELWAAAGSTPPAWLAGRNIVLLLAGGATVFYVWLLIRHTASGGHWINVAKILLFVVFIAAGVVAMLGSPIAESTATLDPFFTGGVTGLLHAMGFTFIILHGFEVIAAVAGEIKKPRKNIPRAMFLSLGIALAVYVPLLFVASSVGVPAGLSLGEFSARHGDTVIAAAARELMGPVGYWLVIVAAVLAFLSALHANVMAGSRVALSMAKDHTLPTVLRVIDSKRKTPAMAIYATGLSVVAILFMVPSLEAAGAAASLIFLISFALAHATTYLARVRAKPGGDSYKTPWFPLIPMVGGASCAALAIFEVVAVPDAGRIVAMWLGLGVILYFALFRTHAEAADASAEALDPSLGRLRGKNPLVLVPIANPAHARCMVEVANALAPSEFARVLLLSVVPPPTDPKDDPLAKLADSQKVVAKALGASLAAGYSPDALITISESPWVQIRRVAQFHDCESLLLGLSQMPLGASSLSPELEELINQVDCDVAIMRAPPDWRLAAVRRIVVPIAGKGEEHELRARLLGSLCRTGDRDIKFVTVLDSATSDAKRDDALIQVSRLAQTKIRGTPSVQVIRSDDPADALKRAAQDADLVVLGLKSVGWQRKVIGPISLQITTEVSCATILLSSKRSRAYSDIYRPLRTAVAVIGTRPKRD